jgi:hypothetical protein
MGTRANIGFRYKEKDWLMYHHSDGGMAWLGLTLLKFCRQYNPAHMRGRVEQFVLIDDDSARPTVSQFTQMSASLNWEPAKREDMLQRLKSKKMENRPTWEDMFRDGCELEDFMGTLNFWPDYSSFILHANCEWAYIINLDTEKLEVYTSHYNAPQHVSLNRPKVKPKGRYCDPYEDENSGRMTRGATLLDELPLKDIREIPEFALTSFAKRIDRQY